jgi:hypothetical protein
MTDLHDARDPSFDTGPLPVGNCSVERRHLVEGIVTIVVVVLIVLFVLGYFGRGKFRV